jgi:hypothetical protein
MQMSEPLNPIQEFLHPIAFDIVSAVQTKELTPAHAFAQVCHLSLSRSN